MFLNPLLYQRMLGLVLYGRGIDAKNGRYPGLNMSRYLGDLLGHADAGVCCEAEVFEYPIGENDDIPFLRRRTRFDECLSPFAHMMHAHIVYIWEWGGGSQNGIFCPCARLVQEAGKFWEVVACRLVRLSVFWVEVGVRLKRSGSFGGTVLFRLRETVLCDHDHENYLDH